VSTLSTETSETAHISADLACSCGYNLRGLALSGRCPECGSAVATNPWLRVRVDSRWGSRVAVGVAMLVPLCVPQAQVVAHYGGGYVYMTALIVAALAALIGGMLISSRDATVTDTATSIVLRWLLRGAAIAGLGLALYAFYARSALFGRWTYGVLSFIANALLMYASLAQLENIALRIGQRRLSVWFAVLRVAVPLIAVAPAFLSQLSRTFGLSRSISSALLLAQHLLLLVVLFNLGRVYHALRVVTPPRLRET